MMMPAKTLIERLEFTGQAAHVGLALLLAAVGGSGPSPPSDRGASRERGEGVGLKLDLVYLGRTVFDRANPVEGGFGIHHERWVIRDMLRALEAVDVWLSEEDLPESGQYLLGLVRSTIRSVRGEGGGGATGGPAG